MIARGNVKVPESVRAIPWSCYDLILLFDMVVIIFGAACRIFFFIDVYFILVQDRDAIIVGELSN